MKIHRRGILHFHFWIPFMASSDLWKWCLSIKQSSSRFRTGQFFHCYCCSFCRQCIFFSFCVKRLHCSHQQVVLVPQGCCLLLRIVKDASNEDHTVRGGRQSSRDGDGFESSKRHSVYFPWHQFHKFLTPPWPGVRGRPAELKEHL